MLERIVAAGSGGQGVIIMGKVLASSAIEDVEHITFFPFYGAEVRGGVSSCQIILSDKEISSPLADVFDTMFIMNQDSVSLYADKLKQADIVVTNSSLVSIDDSEVNKLAVPASDMADKLGDLRVSNFILLGAYIAKRKIITPESIEKTIKKVFSSKSDALVELNIKAFREGLSL